MYQYNDSFNDPNKAAMQHQAVPNVMMDDSQDAVQGVEIQQGSFANIPQGAPTGQDGQHTLPVYAADPLIPQFEIPDPIMRRNFVQKLLNVLLLQNIILLPIVELFEFFTDEPISMIVYGSVSILTFFIYLIFYFFDNIRRYPPMNLLALIIVTALRALHEGILATQYDASGVISANFIIIGQILGLILYTKQDRFKFSNINAILLCVICFIMCVCLIGIISPYTLNSISPGTAIHVIYVVYDIQLMLSGHHGYHLNADEYIFAATNIYADIPNLVWRLIKFAIIDHFIRLYRFFRDCCPAQVC